MQTDLQTRAARLVAAATQCSIMVATAESCTGGMVAAAITAVPGASAMFDRSFVTYTNAAKAEMIGVPPDLIGTEGAVSEAVARAMAEGTIARSNAAIAVSITGIAGPGGGTPTKPVGTVWIATSLRGGKTIADGYCFSGDRDAVRLRAAIQAMTALSARCAEIPA